MVAQIQILILTLVMPSVAAPPPAVQAFVAQSPRCGQEVRWCVGLEVGVVVSAQGEPIQPAAWFAAQVTQANVYFARAGVGFEVTRAFAVDYTLADVETRQQRDALIRLARAGRRRRSAGVPCFLVRSLSNVDAPGVIRGVHWRYRPDTRRRGVILSSIAPLLVLGHELGHYFGLGHSRAPASIMNKRPRMSPPPSEWGFVPGEVKRIVRSVRRARRHGALTMRAMTKRNLNRRTKRGH